MRPVAVFRWIAILLICLIGWPSGARGEQAAAASQTEETTGKSEPGKKEERLFRSPEKSTLRKVLAAPKYLLYPIKYPVKKGLIFAEKVDLANRIMDVFYFNDERTFGWFPKLTFGGATTVEFGASIFHNDLFHKGKEVKAGFAIGDPENIDVEALFNDPSIRGSPAFAKLSLLYNGITDQDYYGQLLPDGTFIYGNNAIPADKKTYELDEVILALDTGYRLSGILTLGGIFDFRAGESEGWGTLPIPIWVTGTYGDMASYLGAAGYMHLDNRDSGFRATRGWLIDLRGGIRGDIAGVDGMGRTLSYTHYSIDMQKYLTLFAFLRTLVLRANLQKTDPLSPEEGVPFFWQPVLDENTALRGYPTGRWRDQGALVFNVEYRYPIWETWDGVIFWDEGLVFHEYSDIRWDGFHWSVGGGLHISSKDDFLFRAQVAGSDEGVQALMKMEQAF